MDLGLKSPTAFSELGQGRDYPSGLSDANPDAQMFEALWGGRKVMELGI